MATAIPAAGAAGPEPAAAAPAPSAAQPPSAPQPSGGAPLSPNERAMAALGALPGQQPAAQPPQEQQPGQPAQQQSAVDQWLASLPEDHPARQEVQSMRSAHGRVRALQSDAERLPEITRAAEVAAIAAVRAGADPYTLAAQIGADPKLLIELAGAPVAPASQPGAPAAAAQPAAAAPGQQGAEQPYDFVRAYQQLKERMNPQHPQSVSKQVFDYRDRAQSLREQADIALAQALTSEDAAIRTNGQKNVEGLRAQARELEVMAMDAEFNAMAQFQYKMYQALNERLKKYEDAEAERTKAVEQRAGVQREWNALGASLRAVRHADGEPMYGDGPNGAGIWSTDANGNLGAPTAKGEIILRGVAQIMADRGWPRTAQSFDDALVIYAQSLPSDDGSGVPAGAVPGGGDATLPGNGLAPGNGAIRPSNSGTQQFSSQVAMY